MEACGICHSDVLAKDGLWPGLPYPRVPGHEIAGRVDDLGPDVAGWKTGQRVGVGWHGGQHTRQYSLIAEEVAAIYPELVTRAADGQVQAVCLSRTRPSRLPHGPLHVLT